VAAKHSAGDRHPTALALPHLWPGSALPRSLLQAYLGNSRLFLEALEELQGQMGVLEEYRTASTLQESPVLRRVSEKVRNRVYGLAAAAAALPLLRHLCSDQS
jgi:hypothetical protein